MSTSMRRAVLTLVVCAVASAQDSREQAKQDFGKGEAAYRLGNCEEAAKHYEDSYRLAPIPIIDDDAYDDIVIGAPGGDGPDGDRAEAGEVIVLGGRDFGAAGQPDTFDLAAAEWDARIVGRGGIDAAQGDRLGSSLAAGRLDAGERDDLAIGAPGSAGATGDRPGAGAAYVVPGVDPLPPEIDLAAGEYAVLMVGAEGAAFGAAVAVANVNGDPYGDALAGAPAGDGAVYAVLGRASFPGAVVDASLGENEWTIVGPEPGASFGLAIAGGTLDADAGDDLAIGAPTATGFAPGAPCAGAIFVVSGDATLLPGDANVEASAGAPAARGDGCDGLGFAVATGDLSGDDLDDVLAAAPRGAGDRGEVIAFVGGVAVLRIVGAEAADELGWGLATGDLGGSASIDLALAAPGFDDPGPPARADAGRAYVLLNPLSP